MEVLQEPKQKVNLTAAPSPFRYVSVDAFRAVTLLLMIFVNDFGTLREIPEWLKHTEANEDGMGFSDVIFPAFLFIVGLSVPLAVQTRLKSGNMTGTTGHILLRSLALLIMGVFHVNLGNYSREALLSRPVWEILITISFFLIWLDYPKDGNLKKRHLLQSLGVVLLILMGALYLGNSAGGTTWMRPQWWGILGLIGWSYLLGSLIYLWSGGKFYVQIAAFLFFMGFNAASHSGVLSFLDGVKEYVWIVGDGSMPAMVMAGIITIQVYRKWSTQRFGHFFLYACIAFSLLLFYGFLTRPWWEISKIRATPSWTAICTGISVLSFAVLAYITDIKGRVRWYDLIKPAGISTLTCYLLPYIHDALISLVPLRLPLVLRTGPVGLGKSLVFSLLIIGLAGLLQKRRIRLKL
ncbi:MAG TPA: DUF5009 domain-containing protein [Sphingobacteriaceae bacterium]